MLLFFCVSGTSQLPVDSVPAGIDANGKSAGVYGKISILSLCICTEMNVSVARVSL